jgi:hypothetical protein
MIITDKLRSWRVLNIDAPTSSFGQVPSRVFVKGRKTHEMFFNTSIVLEQLIYSDLFMFRGVATNLFLEEFDIFNMSLINYHLCKISKKIKNKNYFLCTR